MARRFCWMWNVEKEEWQSCKLSEKHGFTIISIDEREPNLEDVFVQLTGRTIREAEGVSKDMQMKRNMRRAGAR